MRSDSIFSEILTNTEEEQFLSAIVLNKRDSKGNDVSCTVPSSTPSEKTQYLQVYQVYQKNKGRQKPQSDWRSNILQYGGLLTILASLLT